MVNVTEQASGELADDTSDDVPDSLVITRVLQGGSSHDKRLWIPLDRMERDCAELGDEVTVNEQ